jgi:uncharacterized DUF497 family protein
MGCRKGSAKFTKTLHCLRRGDPLSTTYYDPDHSIGEDRYLTIEMSGSGRLIIVSHTDQLRGIRIISARQATQRERKQYEEGTEERT